MITQNISKCLWLQKDEYVNMFREVLNFQKIDKRKMNMKENLNGRNLSWIQLFIVKEISKREMGFLINFNKNLTKCEKIDEKHLMITD